MITVWGGASVLTLDRFIQPDRDQSAIGAGRDLCISVFERHLWFIRAIEVTVETSAARPAPDSSPVFEPSFEAARTVEGCQWNGAAGTRILVVDKHRATRLLLRHAVERDGHVVDEAEDGETALRVFTRAAPDLVLLDGGMQGLDGLDLCAELQTLLPSAKKTPILMVTSLDDDESIARAFKAGATDYIAKPVNGTLLRYRLRKMIAESRNQMHFAYLAHYDAVTGLPNRVLFLDRFEQAVERARRHRDLLALLYLDLDGFKKINDAMGHDAGDRLLKEVSDRLVSLVRSCDTLARLGGDEFVLLATSGVSEEGVRVVAEKMLGTLSKPFPLSEGTASVTASVGAALYPLDGDEIPTLIKNADAAMYDAKRRGRNTYRFVSPQAAAVIAPLGVGA